ncbi:GH15791 [Drosophila grimshawi]|uniref:GH15791 n=2 Tax=Drosophila grimshawi TaxID=7222 RepID=B4IZ68_DROGR|nr:GH15791 [Drosophila grimshawi]
MSVSFGMLQQEACRAESVSYALYLHREELGRPQRSRRLMRVACTKLQLTNELIWRERRQWELEAPSYQQRSALNRERQYRDILTRNMQRQLEKQQQQRKHKLDTLADSCRATQR